MPRMYEPIWQAIKAEGVGKEICIRTRTEAVRRLIQAVRKEKTIDVAIRDKIGMLVEGPLEHRVEQDPADPDFSFIHFKLKYSARLKDI